ncbi:MAG: type II toxin-antitoxin system RelE/ParE family toxin [Bryobacteraceae bacterium]|jgi:plasmid stabilization system protein ParE
MTYRVELTERAARDLNVLYIEKHATDSPAAARWYNRLEEIIYSLERSPYRRPVAPEAGRSRRPLRHLLYGKRPHVYRAIYEIDEHRQLVAMLAIRHGAREPAEIHV